MSRSTASRFAQIFGLSIIAAVSMPTTADAASCAYWTTMSSYEASDYLNKLNKAVDSSNDFLSTAIDACKSGDERAKDRAAAEFLPMLYHLSNVPNAQCAKVPSGYEFKELGITLKSIAAIAKLASLSEMECR